MHDFIVRVNVTREETYVVRADSADEAESLYWDGEHGEEVAARAETHNIEIAGVDPMPELTVLENEDGTIGAIFCPTCDAEIYETDYRLVDGFLDLYEADCGTLIQDPAPIFDRYNRQD